MGVFGWWCGWGWYMGRVCDAVASGGLEEKAGGGEGWCCGWGLGPWADCGLGGWGDKVCEARVEEKVRV